MNRVSNLVGNLMNGTAEEQLEHAQTIKMPERSHQRLRALARFVGRSKSSLAAELLVAAIEDAIEALPDEVTGNYSVGDKSVSAREFVLLTADSYYQELLEDLEIENRPPLAAAM